MRARGGRARSVWEGPRAESTEREGWRGRTVDEVVDLQGGGRESQLVRQRQWEGGGGARRTGMMKNAPLPDAELLAGASATTLSLTSASGS